MANLNYMAIPGMPNRPINKCSKLHTRFVKEIIVSTICDYFKLPVEHLQTKGRYRKFSYPRQVIMYFISEYTDETLLAIGQYFGGRDHTTVLHAKNLIKDFMKVDASMRNEIDEIMQKIIDNHV